VYKRIIVTSRALICRKASTAMAPIDEGHASGKPLVDTPSQTCSECAGRVEHL